MDAGVPLKKPVAGISVGICTVSDTNHVIQDYRILTDIIGWEDAFCDMDCKIAGTDTGITGFQLDLKLRGMLDARGLTECLIEVDGGFVADESPDLADIRHPATHIFEARIEHLCVRSKPHG